jgi:hypothetical protein
MIPYKRNPQPFFIREVFMSEAENAWRLWQLLQLLANMLCERYKREFTEFSAEEKRLNNYYAADIDDTGIPF